MNTTNSREYILLPFLTSIIQIKFTRIIIQQSFKKCKPLLKIFLKIRKNKKEPHRDPLLFLTLCQLSLFYVENLLAVVEAANLAYAVGLEHLVASGVRALYKSGHSELGIVASSLISACA